MNNFLVPTISSFAYYYLRFSVPLVMMEAIMTPLDAVILGAVQGFTEFIPVSSSGHLILAQRFLDLQGNFTFDVLLNFGTLLALFIFFRSRIANIFREVFVEKDWRYILVLIVGVLPVVVVGLIFSDWFSTLDKHPWLVALMLFLFGLPMIFIGKEDRKPRVREDSQASLKDALVIGSVQVLALFPGVSRSGSTIMAGMRRGFSAQAAADFSFLMAIPTILGASLKTLVSSEGRDFMSNHLSLFILGNFVSFVCGALAIETLLRFLRRRGLGVFGYYRVGLAVVLAALMIFKVI